MAIVGASIISCSDLYFLKPLNHSFKQKSPIRISSLSLPSITTATTTIPPSLSSSSPRRLLTTSYSLLDDDGVSGSVFKTVEVDPKLEIMKKALDVAHQLKGTSIYLVGMNSAMKTNLGKLLADALRYYFFDSDGLFVDAAGGEAAAKRLIETDEKGFRESETEILNQLSSMGRLVVSAGNGAVQSTNNLALLRHGISIWVDVPLDMVAKEVVEDGIQLLGSRISSSGSHSEVLNELIVLYKEMQGGYATADATVSLLRVCSELGYDGVHSVTPEDMGLEVLKEIEKLMRVKKMMEDAGRPF